MENMTFDEIVDKVCNLWNEQRIKAFEADSLMERCEEIELEMNDLLKIAKEMNPEAYEEFVMMFARQEEKSDEQ